MDDRNKGEDLREHSRVARNFVARFKAKDKPDSEWQVSTLKDISEKGCFFYSATPFEIDQVLEVKIQCPSSKEPIEFSGEVKRCDATSKGEFSHFGIGVYFLDVDEQKKKEFSELIAFFLKKEQS